ncbi:hypothetical protein [Pseudomonas aeruginosa]|uniref:hypothetical protein n=1 Tax=Pseudomonas aeruginosa TaxID=287 RepID=UPI003D7F5D55
MLTERMIAAMHEDEARLNILKRTRPRDPHRRLARDDPDPDRQGLYYAPGNGDVYPGRRGRRLRRLSRRRVRPAHRCASRAGRSEGGSLDFVLWKGAETRRAEQLIVALGEAPGWHIDARWSPAAWAIPSTSAVATTWSSLYENEIADEAWTTATPSPGCCTVVTISGEKMSKSLGNFFIREVLEISHE